MGHVYKVLDEKKVNKGSKFFPTRFIIELCENVHIHYRNIRIELSTNEFCDMYRSMRKAYIVLTKYLLSHAETKEISMQRIDPYDPGHKKNGNNFDCGEEQSKHRKGIDYIKQLISEGKKIRPIAIVWDDSKNRYKRMDGFKRFWAFKELGYTKINCYILKEYVAGIQENMSACID